MEERKRRPPFAVHLREEHQKLQTRPSSLVPEHGPILGKADQRREGGRGKRFEERKEHRENEIRREDEKEILVFLPLSSHPLPLIHLVVVVVSEANSSTMLFLSTLQRSFAREAELACVSRLAMLALTHNPLQFLQPVMGVSFYKSSITASRFNSLHSAGFFVFYLEHQVKIKGFSFP